MLNALKSKLFLLILVGLSLLQFSFVMMMTHGPHEQFCAFDEHCLLQSVSVTTEAVQPLLTVVLPLVFVLAFASKTEQKATLSFASPPNLKFRQILESTVKRE